MALALPFAYLHTRSGGVSLKIFIGIMIGVGFHADQHAVLASGPAQYLAGLRRPRSRPSLLFLLLAIGALAGGWSDTDETRTGPVCPWRARRVAGRRRSSACAT